jgi:nitrite reductase (NO-forming)
MRRTFTTDPGEERWRVRDALLSTTDRRSVLRRLGGVGVALPFALRAVGVSADESEADEDHDDMTEGTEGAAADDHTEAPVASQPVQPFALYDPALPPAVVGIKDIIVTAKDVVKYVAKDVPFGGWGYDGTIPGPMFRVVEGDTVNVTFRVDSAANAHHSLDFHSAITPPEKNYRTILPGEELIWSFVAGVPGTFMYHCGTPKVLMHIGSGLYGAMVVDPKEGWAPAQELAIVQSDLYVKDGGNGVMVPDYARMLGNGQMDYCVFNGYANQYVENPIAVEVNALVRMFVINAGPSAWASFHVVGTIFDRVLVNGHPKNELFGLQSVTIGPGDGAVVEFRLPEPGPYPFVNHAFGHAAHGAVGVLQAS